jgi:hypothetical protein
VIVSLVVPMLLIVAERRRFAPGTPGLRGLPAYVAAALSMQLAAAFIGDGGAWRALMDALLAPRP